MTVNLQGIPESNPKGNFLIMVSPIHISFIYLSIYLVAQDLKLVYKMMKH